MTWTALKATGSGKLAVYFQIAGVPEVLATAGAPTPDSTTGSWYTDGTHTAVRQWLDWSGITLDERASFMDGTLDVGPLTLTVADPAGAFTALCKSMISRTRTRLTLDLSAGETTTITVANQSGFGASGVVHIGAEAIGYASKTSTTEFTTLTRGLYGSLPAAFDVDTDARPVPVMPAVLDGPHTLVGRRCYLWAGDVVDGALNGATECIYRGYIASDSEAGGGKWRINVEHICQWLSRRVGAELPSASLSTGYYIGDVAQRGIDIVEQDPTTGTVVARVSVKVPAGYYATPIALKDALNTALIAACTSFNRVIRVRLAGSAVAVNSFEVTGSASDTYTVTLMVTEHDPLNVLGFEAGIYYFDNDSAFTALAGTKSPDRAAIIFHAADSSLPTIRVADNSHITADAYVVFGSKASPYVLVDSKTGTTAVTLALNYDGGRLDPWPSVGQGFVFRVPSDGEDKELIVRHCIKTSGDIIDVIKQLTHTASSQVEPESWCVRGLVSDDFEWSELTSALAGAPVELREFTDAIVDPIEFDKFVVDRLGLLCVAPRLTTSGKIGFVPFAAPCELNAATIEVNSAVWAQFQAAEVRTLTGGDPLVNQLLLAHSYNYRDGKWATDAQVSYDDGVNCLSKTAAHRFELRGLEVGRLDASHYRTAQALSEAVASFAIGVHFGYFGRQVATVSLPCVWKAKQLNIGDVVSITHPCVVDVDEGAVGVTARYGLVTGRIGAVTDNIPDQLIILLPAQRRVSGWAPAAIGTGWTAGSKTLAFSATNLFSADDLSEFKADDYVRIVSWNTETSTVYSASIQIVSVGSGTIVLASDPFAPFPATGALVTLPAYDSASATQQKWLYQGDTGFTLGTAADEAYVWAP